MQLARIKILSKDLETNKAILFNNNFWVPKSVIIKQECDSIIVKAWFLKDKNQEYEELGYLDILKVEDLKPLKHLLNQNSAGFLPKDALEHQEDIFNKAKGLKCCALFMDMGTGKSKLYIDLANYHYKCKNIDKVLFFAPPTTLDNFKNELKLWNKSDLPWQVLSIHELSVKRGSKKWELFKEFIDEKTMIIIDESHRIKNIDTLASQTANYLGIFTDYKIIGSGTSAPNQAIDLLGQFRFLTPSQFIMSKNRLKKSYLKIGDKGILKGTKNEIEILEKTFPYTFSVNKDECLNLQAKVYKPVYINDAKLLEHYNSYFEKVSGVFLASKGSLMGFLQNLRKTASGRDLEGNVVVQNPKINALKDILLDINEKTIIWHNFYFELEDILQAVKDNYVLLNGDMSNSEKIFAINEFKNNPNVKYLLATEMVGGVGINLTESSCNIYFSNSFNLVDRLQSEDRIHRIGQKKQCIYYDLYTDKTIDIKIKNSLIRKNDFLTEIRKTYKENGKQEILKRLSNEAI